MDGWGLQREAKRGRSSENVRKEIVRWESDRSREPKWKPLVTAYSGVQLTHILACSSFFGVPPRTPHPN